MPRTQARGQQKSSSACSVLAAPAVPRPAPFPFHLYLTRQSPLPSLGPRSSQTDAWKAEEPSLSFLPPPACAHTADTATSTGGSGALLDWDALVEQPVQRLLSPLLQAALEEVRYEQRRQAAQALVRSLQGRLEAERSRVAAMEEAEQTREDSRQAVIAQARADRDSQRLQQRLQREEVQREVERVALEEEQRQVAASRASLQLLEEATRLLHDALIAGGSGPQLQGLHCAREALDEALRSSATVKGGQ